jgi:magnesium transporter
MKFRLPRPRHVVDSLRNLAQQDPDQAEAYLDTHQDEWESLAESHPHSAADILEALDEVGAADLLSDLSTEEAADVLDEMRPEAAADVLEELETEEAAAYVGAMDADQAADLIAMLDDDTRNAVLSALEPEAAADIRQLLQYAADSAGGIMTTEIAALPTGITAGEAIETLRTLHEELGANLAYVYVVDDANRLRGVISFRDLVFARPGAGVDEVMILDPVSVTTSTDREEVSELVQRYHLLAIPVTDHVGHLVGMVKVSEALEAVQVEATEDISVMVGAGVEESVFTPVATSVRRRLPWIMFNLAVGFVNSRVILGFESTIAALTAVAAYMPLAGAVGGNSGAQSLAVIIRSMALGDLPPGRAGRAIRREATVGLVTALTVAVVAGLLGSVLAADHRIGLVVGIAILVNLTIAGLAGASIPVVLRSLGQDPALASNIFLTMTTDLVGLSGYLLTATLLL